MRKSYDSVISHYNKVGPQAAICRFTSGFTFQPQMRYPVLVQISEPNKGDFCLIGQFFLRLSLINFTSGSGRLEKADKDLKKQQGRLA